MENVLKKMCESLTDLLAIINSKPCTCDLPECPTCGSRKDKMKVATEVLKVGLDTLKEAEKKSKK